MRRQKRVWHILGNACASSWNRTTCMLMWLLLLTFPRKWLVWMKMRREKKEMRGRGKVRGKEWSSEENNILIAKTIHKQPRIITMGAEAFAALVQQVSTFLLPLFLLLPLPSLPLSSLSHFPLSCPSHHSLIFLSNFPRPSFPPDIPRLSPSLLVPPHSHLIPCVHLYFLFSLYLSATSRG